MYLTYAYLKAYTLHNRILIHEGVMEMPHVDKSGEMVSSSLVNGVCVFWLGDIIRKVISVERSGLLAFGQLKVLVLINSQVRPSRQWGSNFSIQSFYTNYGGLSSELCMLSNFQCFFFPPMSCNVHQRANILNGSSSRCMMLACEKCKPIYVKVGSKVNS